MITPDVSSSVRGSLPLEKRRACLDQIWADLNVMMEVSEAMHCITYLEQRCLLCYQDRC